MLLQRGKDIIKWNSVNPLKCGAMIMKQRSIYYRNACFITKWDRYYKLGQELLQSGAGYLLQSGSIVIVKWGIDIIKWGDFIAKWGSYCRKGQYIFVTLGQMETHIYRQGQCGLKTEFWGLLIFGRLLTKQFLLMFVFRRLKFVRFNKV